MRKHKTIITSGTTPEFFESGLKFARSVDKKKKVVARRRIITFEDPRDMLKFISDKKMSLMRLIRKKPVSVTGLAKALKRERSAVNRDVRILEIYGLVKTHYANNPGHGRNKIVEPMSPYPIEIHAVF